MNEIRAKLESILGIYCIFSNDVNNNNKVLKSYTMRCMLENNNLHSKLTTHKAIIEDIIIRLNSLSSDNTYMDHSRRIEAIKVLLSKIFVRISYSNISTNEVTLPISLESLSLKSCLAKHPGISNILQIIETTSDLITIQSFSKHSLLSISRFHASTTLSSATLGNTGGLGTRDLRLRFIIYQLIQATAFIHSQGLCLDPMIPSDVMLDDDMWLYLPIGLSERMCASVNHRKQTLKDLELYFPLEKPIGYNEPITVRWINGKISNFEYLMAINYAAGRTMLDPLYHPIIPWVTDFSAYPVHANGPNGGLRDLSKTKFRLSKGDAQLETTFKHSDPPHHVPESLSELTYYIYLARRTPVQVLRRVVRDVFVPEHYPHSMSRIYDWTPDECIPEFYTDPCMLTSIHLSKGLSDIELPYFASTPSEFITFHRNVLESPEVSKQLHSWIDLTFGYCLCGEAAIANMNVPLYNTISSGERSSIDSPDVNKNPGFVILFDRPHPQKKTLFSHKSSSITTTTNDINEQLKNKLMMNNLNSLSMDAFLSLDKNKHLHTNKNNNYTNYQIHSHESNTHIPTGNLLPTGNSLQKKSLLQPRLMEPSLKYLSHAKNINLIIDKTYHSTVVDVIGEVKNTQFAASFDTTLDAAYMYPTNQYLSQIENNILEDNIKDHFKGYNIDDIDNIDDETENLFWDKEFNTQVNHVLKSMRNKRKLTKDNGDDFIENAQADDMLAIGCIIAELHTSRPLMNHDNAYQLNNNNMNETMKFVYNKTNGIPLVIRRLTSLLLSPNPILRPKATEILQGCIWEDYDSHSNKAFSLQRSGGSEPGYIDFQKINENKYKNITNNNTIEIDLSNKYKGKSFISATNLHNRLINYLEHENNIETTTMHRNERIELLYSSCSNLFPKYFKIVYQFIGELKLCQNELLKIKMILDKLDIIINIPLEGINLILRHLLIVISNASPFCNNYSDSNNELRNIERRVILKEYHRIIDVLGLRLGINVTEKLLVPKVIEFLNGLASAEMVEVLLRTQLWNILLLRCGMQTFLRYFLPILLTYISSSTLYYVYNDSMTITNGSNITPLWAKGEYRNSENNLWLITFSIQEINDIEQAAMSAFLSLVEPEAMGLGLGSRYLVPALLSLIGSPKLAGAGYEQNIKQSQISSSSSIMTRSEAEHTFNELAIMISSLNNTNNNNDTNSNTIISSSDTNQTDNTLTDEMNKRIDSQMSKLELYIIENSIFDPQRRYVSRTVVNLCMQLGDLVVSELILSRIFNDILTELSIALDKSDGVNEIPDPCVVAALMEVLLLLNGILPSLHPETVLKDYLRPSKITGMSLPKLLSIMPIYPTWSIGDSFTITENKCLNIDAFLHVQRFHNMLSELCRLIVSSSLVAGLTPYVLPAVDIFFRNFVNAFGTLPVESKTMLKGFEIAAELFLPLAQISGPDAFYTAVPNLNPRLEMWLVTIGSNIPAKSPPLPNTIWPPVMSEEEKKVPKKKGFIQWISGKISSTSLSSSISVSSTTTSAATTKSSITTTGISNIDTRGINYLLSSRINNNEHQQDILNNTLQNVDSSIYSASIRNKKTSSMVEIINEDPAIIERGSDVDEQLIQNSSSKSTGTTGTNLVHEDALETIEDDVDMKQELNNNSSQIPIPSIENDLHDTNNIALFHNQEHDNMSEEEENNEEEEDDSDSEEEHDENRKDYVESVSDNIQDLSFHLTPDIHDDQCHDKNQIDVDINRSNQINPQVIPTSEMNQIFPDPNEDIFPLDYNNTNTNSYHLLNDEYSATATTNTTIKYSNPYNIYQKIMTTPGKRSVRNNVRSGLLGSLLLSKTTTKSNTKLSVGSIFMNNDIENIDDVENRELYYNEMAWLLAGNGRWNVDQDLKEKTMKEQMKIVNHNNRYSSNARYLNNFTDWNPAAQISMTTPKIATDVSIDANSLFTLQMQSNTQWKLEDNPGMIRCMAVNAVESLLITCSRSGVRLWSLTSHPLIHVSSYMHHSSPPFNAGFLRNGINAATCDGNIHIWDIESRGTIAYLNAASSSTGYTAQEKGLGFTSMSIIPSRYGIVPCTGTFGDDQLLTTLASALAYHDIRLNCSKAINQVAEWCIPQIPVQSGFISSIATSEQQPLQLTCAASQENYLYTGSSNGGIWIIDRRMGKLLNSWQAHDGPILKLSPVSDTHLLSVSDRSAAIWEYTNEFESTISSLGKKQPRYISPYSIATTNNPHIHHAYKYNESNSNDDIHWKDKNTNTIESPIWMGLGGQGEIKKVLNIKNMPDCINSASTIMLSALENRGSSSVNSLNLSQEKGLMGITSKPQYVLYCISGHKLHAGKLPTFDRNIRETMNLGNNKSNDINDQDELRLNQSYFMDRKGLKITKSKLNITSSVLLPLRRLLLVGTEDGLVRIVS